MRVGPVQESVQVGAQGGHSLDGGVKCQPASSRTWTGRIGPIDQPDVNLLLHQVGYAGMFADEGGVVRAADSSMRSRPKTSKRRPAGGRWSTAGRTGRPAGPSGQCEVWVSVDITRSAAGRAVRRAAVLGSPITHSLSPVLHGAAYQALGLQGWHYDRIECDEAGLPGLIEGMGPEWAGLSLTMPLKRVALTVAGEVSPLARAVGAANTMVSPSAGPAGGSRAENTDVAGLVEALREAGLTRVEQPVILGAGGTAQAALAAVRELGHQSPAVLVRNLSRTGELRETAERLGRPRVMIRARAAPRRRPWPRCASSAISHRPCWCATFPVPESYGRPPSGWGCGR